MNTQSLDTEALADPSLKTARLAKEAEEKRLDDIETAKRQKKYDRENARFEKKWNAGWRPQERAKTARDLRAETTEFRMGHDKANEIGLDDQIEHQTQEKLS